MKDNTLIKERNSDLMLAYEQVIKENRDIAPFLSKTYIFSLVVQKEAPSFYISDQVVRRIIRCKGETNELGYYHTRDKDVYQLYLKLKELHEDYRNIDIIRIITNHRAPSFYLNHYTASQIIDRILRKWK